MGISDLLSFIREKCPTAYRLYPFDLLTGKVMVIDISIIMYAEKSKARRTVANNTNLTVNFDLNDKEVQKEWLQNILNFTTNLLQHKIRPVFVFDGPPHPAKNAVKEQRKEKRRIQKEKIVALQARLANCPSMHYPAALITELKTLLVNYIEIPRHEMLACQTMLAHCGLDVVQAQHEAEQACAMLLLENKAQAVFSRDSDLLVYGCPILLNEITTQHGKLHFYGYDLATILQDLQLPFYSFRDFAIMCGCDYNSNIPRIGVKRAYTLIKEKQCIENVGQSHDITILNHVTCRQLFSPLASEQTIKVCDDLVIDGVLYGNHFTKVSPYAFDIMRQYNLENNIENLKKLYSKFS